MKLDWALSLAKIGISTGVHHRTPSPPFHLVQAR